MTTTETNGSAVAARSFPDGFLWGAATSAYQIEGGALEDGRGPSVWDTFSHTPGKVCRGDTGDIACDFYHRSKKDLDLIKAIGLGAFRFSISWPRVQPAGCGPVNKPGLDFYRSLVEELQSRGIVPCITLYHWDLPQALEDSGGWANRDTAQWFAEYAGIVAEAIGEVGSLWITLNEPQIVTHHGYRLGMDAPGHADNALAAAATHHLLLAHGLAVAALRSVLSAPRIGIALNMDAVRAANREEKKVASVTEAEQNRIFLDPILHGRYPAKARKHMLPPPSLIAAGDMEIVSTPIDFLGINYYQPLYVKLAHPAGLLADEAPIPGRPGVVLCNPKELPRTVAGWLVEPEGLYDLLRSLSAELAPGCKLYVTENGCAANDYVTPEGLVNDIERVEYLYGHLGAAWRAIQDGIPLAGYFCWSLLDNFEWGAGYQKRFGLVFVEFGTQRRIRKRSSYFYESVVKANELGALDLGCSAPPLVAATL
jgi:beta-glucosidase